MAAWFQFRREGGAFKVAMAAWLPYLPELVDFRGLMGECVQYVQMLGVYRAPMVVW